MNEWNGMANCSIDATYKSRFPNNEQPKTWMLFFFHSPPLSLYKYKIPFLKSVYGFYRKHFHLNVKLATTAKKKKRFTR